MRRRLGIGLMVLVALLALAPEAFAAAGGGSAGFGGGGGGGHGKGAGLYFLVQILIRIAILGHGLGALFLVGLVLLWLFFTRVAPRARNFTDAQRGGGRTTRRQMAKRERRVELAAAEASDEDPAFAPDHVRESAASLFKAVQHAWDAGDRRKLAALVGPDLMQEWNRRLDDLERRGWHNRVKLLGEPTVEYVGLKHRGTRAEDRVTVRIVARLRDYVEDNSGRHVKRVGRLSEIVPIREFWTLAKDSGDRWMLISIEQGAEGSHVLGDEIVATPWSDDQTMHDEAVVEQAVADAVPDGTKVAEVADLNFEGDARAAALDLSLADGRFAPDVLEVAARRAVQAWADAVDGDDSALRALARSAAVSELLHPGDPSGRTRVVVRGPRLKQIRVVGLDAGAQPPTMSIEVDLEGRRYIEDRDTTAVLAGSQTRARSFTEHWTFALEGDAAQPWRITAVGAPIAHA